KSDRLVVMCPVWANDALNGIESKRWSKAKRAWLVPLMRRNVDAINNLIANKIATAEPVAQDALIEAEKRISSLNAKTEGFPAWFKFKTKPRQHQVTALNKAYGKRAFALHMDMGTGKSKTAIDLACAYRMEGKIDAV